MNPSIASDLLGSARSIASWIVAIRRRLHQTPELLYALHQTSRIVQTELDKLQISYRAGIAETGIVATVGAGDAGCVALRADMDALPIQEQTDVSFRSTTDGRMHACGHDCHTAMLLGAARLLKERESELKGTVKLIFQPAEEGGAGAQQMCQQGVMDDPDVAKVFGIHVWPTLASGMVTGKPGPLMASTNCFRIVVTGKGGHAAMPHMVVDPVVTASKIILEAQTLVSREQDPLQPCVISFTRIQGGQAYNVIPESVEIGGTIRSLCAENKEYLKTRLMELARGIAALNYCTVAIDFPSIDYPTTRNDPQLWEEVHRLGELLVGRENFPLCQPGMGGEDFAFYAEHAPTCFVKIGTRNEQEDCVYGLHHPKFKVDEAILPLGTAFHVAFALANVGPHGALTASPDQPSRPERAG